METQDLPTTLRPLRLGELLDRAIRLYRANFLTFIGIIAVVYVPLMVLQTAASALLNGSMVSGRLPAMPISHSAQAREPVWESILRQSKDHSCSP